jgi:hypothetical protein
MNDENRFYMTYARSRPSQLVPWIEANDVPLLTNAIHRWSEATERLLDMWEYDTPHVIDAGGYNVMAKYVTKGGELDSGVTESDVQEQHDTESPFYPWKVPDYHEWLCEHSDEFKWATVMDYACEDRFNVLWSVEERVEATWEHTVEHFNTLDDSGAGYTLLPVLQGRSANDYVDFYERLEDHGIPCDHVGLGTVCRLASEKKIVDLENEIRERTGVKRMHGFGVKIEAFKHGATFESADSQAWAYGPTNGNCLLDEGNRLREIEMTGEGDSLHRTVESFKQYYSYVTRLQQGESDVELDSGAVTVDDDELAKYAIRAGV